MDRGAMALQVNEGTAKLVHLPDPAPEGSLTLHRLDATLTADGAALLDWRAEVSGVDASEWRVRFHAAATRKQRVQQIMGTLLPGSEVTAVEANDLDDVEQNVAMRVRGKAVQFARNDGDVLDVPLGRKEHMVRDYAALATRKLDVRIYARWTEEDDWTVRLPARATARGVPSSASGSSPFGSYELSVESNGNVVHAKTTVALMQTRIPPSAYGAFRAWCETVDRALGLHAAVVLR